MAKHYVCLARGVEGSKYSDFTYDTAAGTVLFEFAIQDGVTPTKTEVLKALEAFERHFENMQQVILGSFDVKG
jgi:hypothetical protein